MFFTETSRKKGHTGDGTTKVIRIHLLGLIPYYSKLIISTLYRKATPRDHIINFLHMHYPTARKTATESPTNTHEKSEGFVLCDTNLVKFEIKCYKNHLNLVKMELVLSSYDFIDMSVA